MKYARMNGETIEELNPDFIEHNGRIYTNPINNPLIDIKELGYKIFIIDNMPTHDSENEKVVMYYRETKTQIHRSWRVEELTEEEKEEEKEAKAQMRALAEE